MTEQESNKLIIEINKSYKHITKDNLSDYEKEIVDMIESSGKTAEELKSEFVKEAKNNTDLMNSPLDALQIYENKEKVKYAKNAYNEQKESVENSTNRLAVEEERTKKAKESFDKINNQIEDLRKNETDVIEGYKKDRDNEIENATRPLKDSIKAQEEKVPTLNAELDEVNKKIDELNNDVANRKNIMASFDENIKNEQKLISDNNEKISLYNKKIESIDKEINELNIKKEKLEVRFNKRDSLRKTIEKCDKEIPTYESNVKSILSKIDEILRNNNNNTNDPVYKEQFEKLNTESLKLASTKELQSRTQEEVKYFDAEYEGDKFIYDKNNIDIQTRNSSKNDFLNRIEKAKDEIELSKKKIEDAKKEKDDFKKNIDKSSSTLKEYNNKKKSLSDEVEALNKDVLNKKEELEKVTTNVTNEANNNYKVKESTIKASIEKSVEALAPSLKEAKENYDECLMQENNTKQEIESEKVLENDYKQKLEKEIISELKKTNSEINKKINKCDFYLSIKEIMDNSKDGYVKSDKANIEGLASVKRAYLNYKNNNGPIGRFFKFLPWTKANKEYKLFDNVRSHYTSVSGISKEDVDNYLDNNRLSDDLRNSKNAIGEEEYDKIINQGVYYNPITFEKHEGISIDQYRDAVGKHLDEIKIVDTLELKDVYDKKGFINIFKTENIIDELNKFKSDKNKKLINDLIKYAGDIAPDKMKNETIEHLVSYSAGEKRPLNVPENLINSYKNALKEHENNIVRDKNAVLENKSSLTIKDDVYELSHYYKEENERQNSLDDIIKEQQMLDAYVEGQEDELSHLGEDVSGDEYRHEEEIEGKNIEEEAVDVNQAKQNNL